MEPNKHQRGSELGTRAGPDGDREGGVRTPGHIHISTRGGKEKEIRVFPEWLEVSRVSRDLLLWPSSSKALM